MPDIKIYVPDEMYYKLKKTPNRSKLIQELLTEYWHSNKKKGKGEKKKWNVREKKVRTPAKKPQRSTLNFQMVRGI